jgi:hypothetical protein
MRGHKQTAEHIRHQKESRQRNGHSLWAGDLVGYLGMHARLRAFFAGAVCRVCGDSPIVAALKTGRATHYAVVDGRPREYSIIMADYWPLCRSCHARYDRVNFGPKAEARHAKWLRWVDTLAEAA